MEKEAATKDDPIHKLVEEAIRLANRGDYAKALGTFETHLNPLSGGSIEDKQLAARAFSRYGLCVAMVRRRYAEAVKYCKISLKTKPRDPDHHLNLAMVYSERNQRKLAIEAINTGLRVNPKHSGLNRLHDELGRRNPPVLSFLHRSNPLNIWLGKLLRGRSD